MVGKLRTTVCIFVATLLMQASLRAQTAPQTAPAAFRRMLRPRTRSVVATTGRQRRFPRNSDHHSTGHSCRHARRVESLA